MFPLLFLTWVRCMFFSMGGKEHKVFSYVPTFWNCLQCKLTHSLVVVWKQCLFSTVVRYDVFFDLHKKDCNHTVIVTVHGRVSLKEAVPISPGQCNNYHLSSPVKLYDSRAGKRESIGKQGVACFLLEPSDRYDSQNCLEPFASLSLSVSSSSLCANCVGGQHRALAITVIPKGDLCSPCRPSSIIINFTSSDPPINAQCSQTNCVWACCEAGGKMALTARLWDTEAKCMEMRPVNWQAWPSVCFAFWWLALFKPFMYSRDLS